MLRSESHMLWNVQLFHFLYNQQQNMEELQSCPHSFLSKPTVIATRLPYCRIVDLKAVKHVLQILQATRGNVP
jgi:hypothetical protein